LLDEVVAHLRAQRWCEDDVFGVHLAMEEALVNAIIHGNHGAADKQVRVACLLDADHLRVEIADQGPGFDPHKLPDPTCAERLRSPCGRGVMLMRAFMSRVEFNAAGNRVILEKQRSPAKDQGPECSPAE
jgi:serine/threonine-protein kinase RsbW